MRIPSTKLVAKAMISDDKVVGPDGQWRYRPLHDPGPRAELDDLKVRNPAGYAWRLRSRDS